MLTTEQMNERVRQVSESEDLKDTTFACMNALRDQINSLTEEYVHTVASLLKTYEFEARLMDYSIVLSISSSPLHGKKITNDTVSVLGVLDSVQVSLKSIADSIKKVS